MANAEGWAQEVKSKRITNVYVTHFGREGKSGAALLYKYRMASQVHHSLTGDIEAAASYLHGVEEGGVVVFVDDFVGSGRTCREGIEAFREECQARGVTLEPHHVYVVSLAGIRAGIDFARATCREVASIFVDKEIGADDQAFSPAAGIFATEKERADAELMCRAIGKQLEPKHPVGYEESQALIVFEHRCPNNTLPVFYKSGRSYEGRPWVPLFPR